jgi:hypothetical protein
MNPAHATLYYSSDIHFNIIHSPTFRFFSGLFASGFPTKTLYAFLFSPLQATCSVYINFCEFTIEILFGEKY